MDSLAQNHVGHFSTTGYQKRKKKSSISLITESKMHIKGKIDQRQPIRIKNWFFDYGYKKEEKFLVEKSLSCCIGLLFDPVYEPETDSSFCHHHECWADSSTLTKIFSFSFSAKYLLSE